MRVDALEYDLPPELIAQQPLEDREVARLMVLPPCGLAPQHQRVSVLPELLPPGALVVVNDTRVVPARLQGRKRDTFGHVEVLLVQRVGTRELEIGGDGSPTGRRNVEVWRALGKPSRSLRPGTEVEVFRRGAKDRAPSLFVRMLEHADPDGLLQVALWTSSGEPVDAAVRASGHVPLPPYIKREDRPDDFERYQTVYARHDGAIAAPTAGLHLTKSMIGRLADRGCQVACVTLHVGLGTFQSVQVDDLDQHPMHTEHYVVPQSTADAIARARAIGAPIVAVGTTTVRALESAADADRPGHVSALTGETRLLIQPGYAWRVVDGLMTNFHLPRSTLLALVCAFAGAERVLSAYRVATRERYRFFSYGDAMLLWRQG